MRSSGLGPGSPWLHARARGSPIPATECVVRCSGDLLPSSPPAEQATARKDQTWQTSTGDGTGHCRNLRSNAAAKFEGRNGVTNVSGACHEASANNEAAIIANKRSCSTTEAVDATPNDRTHDTPGACCTAGFQSPQCPLWVISDRRRRSHSLKGAHAVKAGGDGSAPT